MLDVNQLLTATLLAKMLAKCRRWVKGLRWALLKDRERLNESQRADLDTLIAQLTTKRTARAWLYREQLS